MSARPATAMVMAAGLGKRMRPLTETRPKALIEVAGRPLIDYVIAPLIAAGVQKVVVNVHAHADQLQAYLASRKDAEFLVSDERARLLETGGGVKKARPHLGDDPIWVANSDYIWIDEDEPPLEMLARTWDPARMDSCVIVVPKARTSGFDTPGDFFRAESGALTHRGGAAEAPLHCFGIQILNPAKVYADPREAFSLFDIWYAATLSGRMFGVQPEGYWMQVGDPAARDFAEAKLRG
jgi:MurNAc alpha-1-phosphate uridylyltransferase